MAINNRLIIALQWREDVAVGEMIESKDYRKIYLGFDSITQKELDAICAGANEYYKRMESKLRIGNSFGELIPWILM